MKLTVQRSDLARSLALTQSVVEKKSSMPILANLLLHADEKGFRVSATDLEITTVVRSSAQVSKDGRITVSARVLTDIVRELPDGEVKLEVGENERLSLKAGSSSFSLIGISADEFPSLPGVALTPKASIQRESFLEMISKTIYSVSQDETRFNLNGVCFEVQKDRSESALRMVATDGHRLALITRKAKGFTLEDSVIVPTKGLVELRKVLSSEEDDEVLFDVHDGFFIAETRNVKVATRLIDGEFPDYKQVLPKDEGIDVVLKAEDFLLSLRRTALMVSDRGKCVRLDFTDEDLTVSSSSPELGEARDSLPVKIKGGKKPDTVGFNARYIIDFLNSLGSTEEVCLEIHGELGPGKLSSMADESYLAIVMPMRLQ
jgi:DNA polymerase-3 subunit beta